MKKTKTKSQDLIRFALLIVGLVFLNLIFQGLYLRIDLTGDKRYSISEASRKVMKDLKGTLYVEVFLEGEFPSGFKRLQRAILETLEQFRSISGDKIEFSFINPSEAPDAKSRNAIFEQLAKKGLQPTNLMVKEGSEQVQKIIFPGALIRVKDKEIPVQLLKGNQALSPAERLNQSVEGVEFELANGIKQATSTSRPKIAILTGHGELTGKSLQDIGLTLKQFYEVESVNLSSKDSLSGYDLILVPKPREKFDEFDKFKLDQFIVKGGKAMFFLDGIQAELDSIKPDGSLAFPYPLNLDDFFFRLGFRLNPDLILDMNCGAIPLVVGIVGDKPETRMVPWRFYPVLNEFGRHPIVRNMDALYGRFVSTIDTTISPQIKKTGLVFTSKYSRIQASPVRLSFNEARLSPSPDQYKRSRLPVAYLLEGRFTSLYQNRMIPEASQMLGFKEIDKPSKVIVVGDGDFIRNDTNRAGSYFGLGYDRFMATTFANKDFILNAISYLLDENGVILARNKSIALRPLDMPRVNKDKLLWQSLNLILPVVLVVLFGLVILYRRRLHYRIS